MIVRGSSERMRLLARGAVREGAGGRVDGRARHRGVVLHRERRRRDQLRPAAVVGLRAGDAVPAGGRPGCPARQVVEGPRHLVLVCDATTGVPEEEPVSVRSTRAGRKRRCRTSEKLPGGFTVLTSTPPFSRVPLGHNFEMTSNLFMRSPREVSGCCQKRHVNDGLAGRSGCGRGGLMSAGPSWSARSPRLGTPVPGPT